MSAQKTCHHANPRMERAYMSLDNSPNATACPRCDSLLQAGAYQGQSVQHCPSCAGTLFAPAALGNAIELLSAEFFSKICPDTVLPELPTPDGLLGCPLCLHQMEHYGYMGSRKVMLDGCSLCNVVWVVQVH